MMKTMSSRLIILHSEESRNEEEEGWKRKTGIFEAFVVIFRNSDTNFSNNNFASFKLLSLIRESSRSVSCVSIFLPLSSCISFSCRLLTTLLLPL